MQQSDKDYKAHSITLRDIYKHYPYPCWDVTKNTVPIPYIPKDQLVCDHKRTLTFKQYRKILKIYSRLVTKFLLNGIPVDLPYYLGQLRMYKYKPTKNKRFDIHHFLTTGEKKYYKSRHTQGYIPLFKWRRALKQSRLQNRWIFKCLPARKTWKQISDALFENGSTINKFSDI